MMEIASATASAIAVYAATHPILTYGIIFLGSYLETVVVINFVVRGEIFFIGGGILAGVGILDPILVVVLCFVGSILGDHTSYWMGKRFGKSLFREGRRILNPNNYEKGRRFFDRFGAKAIFIARLLGPLTWITPFIAGIYKVRYREFLPYNVLGVVVGVGQLLIIGYLFGAHYQRLLSLQQNYVGIAIVGIGAVLVLYHAFKTRWFEYLMRLKGKIQGE